MKHIKGIMRRALAALTLLCALAAPGFDASAATEEQMSKGRATAAAFYIRQAFPKEAGALVGKKFNSMQELKDAVQGNKVLEEAYQKFRAKGMRDKSEYSSWGKEEYLEYWSSKFFTNAGLSNSGMQSSQIRSALSGVDVTGGSNGDAAQPDDDAQNAPEEQITVPQEEPVVQDYQQQVFNGPYSDSAKVTDSAVSETVRETEESGSSTWIYVIILIVLIIIVIWLVVFALKNMRNGESGNVVRNGSHRMNHNSDDSIIIGAQPQQPRQQPLYNRQPQQPAADPAAERMRRDLEESRRAEMDARAQADALARRLASLEEEVRSLRDRQQLYGRQQDSYSPRQQETYGERTAPRTLNDSYSRESVEPVQPLRAPGVPGERPARIGTTAPRLDSASDTRVIYLGRANRQGIFVRADKRFVEGKTIYRLETSDGLTGTFTVDPSPQVADWASLDPESAFCAASEVRGNVGGFSRIMTESPGTAIFEGGCWRVIRSALIRLE